MTIRPTSLVLAALVLSLFSSAHTLHAQTSSATATASAIEPVIAPILAAIEPAGIQRNIEKLVSFGTRHTLSDTSSETRGIGAARRWIKSELDRCGAGKLQVAFDGHLHPVDRF